MSSPDQPAVIAQYRRAARRFLHGLGRVIDAVLPPRCPASGEMVERAGTLSPAFWQQLTFITAPHCGACGMPFGLDLGGAQADEILCGACLAQPFAFDRARSCVVYNDASRQLILGFKYGDRLHTVTTFLPWLQRAGGDMINACDVIIPVPLHRRRLWQRRFNQSAVLARALAKACGKTCLPGGMLRLRHTPPQKGLSRDQRRRNVAQVFAVSPDQQNNIAGKRVLLIDDVFTSGATLNACARVLRQAGAVNIDVLTLARVTREDFN